MSVTWFYEPWTDFDRLFDEAFTARTLGQPRQRELTGTSQVTRPRMDLHEDANNNIVTATFEFPGFKKEDVYIDVHNGRLTVSAESSTSSEKEEGNYAVRERRYGKFARTLQLPQGIKDGEVRASMDHGVLTVTFPRAAPEQAPRRIAIS